MDCFCNNEVAAGAKAYVVVVEVRQLARMAIAAVVYLDRIIFAYNINALLANLSWV